MDQLRPYELNPRITRNPLYEEIKASIRERGLDTAPAITKRPDADYYIIRNGGNTRLSILQELWSETKEDRFFRIHCLFRPWTNEIAALTGHLAENELQGKLTFIERALAVEKAREIYEAQAQMGLTQKEVSSRLALDGYPVSQTLISRMQDAISYLLPAIPIALYGGLSKNQISNLLGLRKSASRSWLQHPQVNGEYTDESKVAQNSIEQDFNDFFFEILSLFDGETEEFDFNRLQDEVIGHMAKLLGVSYDLLALEFSSKDKHTKVFKIPIDFERKETIDPEAIELLDEAALFAKKQKVAAPIATIPVSPKKSLSVKTGFGTQISNPQPPQSSETSFESQDVDEPVKPIKFGNDIVNDDQHGEEQFIQAHIISGGEQSTPKVQAIQGMVAAITGEPVQNFTTNVVQSIPVKAGGLYPISDVWYIEPNLDTPERLRIHVGQLALEIADEFDLSELIEVCEKGVGYTCNYTDKLLPDEPPPALTILLRLLQAQYIEDDLQTDCMTLFTSQLLASFLLRGGSQEQEDSLSDVGVVKLFRMVRLIRRLHELDEAIKLV